MEKKCPACGSTDAKQEAGEYALLQLTQGRLRLDLESAGTSAVVVSARVCNTCGFVALYEAS